MNTQTTPEAPQSVEQAAPGQQSTTPATPAATTPAPGSQPPAEHAYIPEKFRVLGQDGKLDLETSAQKLAESYQHAVRRIGSGDVPPERPDGYQVKLPEQFADVELPPEAFEPFKERAHQAGLTPSQFEFVIGEYLQALPALMQSGTRVSREEAQTALEQAWGSPVEVKANMDAVERAVAVAPPELQSEIRQKYATDPTFWRFAAIFGKETREDRPASSAGGTAPIGDITAVMQSEAYRNAKHPDHAKVSAAVRRHFEALHRGDAA
jgi:hypothetical protein